MTDCRVHDRLPIHIATAYALPMPPPPRLTCSAIICGVVIMLLDCSRICEAESVCAAAPNIC